MAEYEVITIEDEMWLFPKFTEEDLTPWERLWQEQQSNVFMNDKIPIERRDAYALEEYMGESISIKEIYEIWRTEFGVRTAPKPEYLECPDCSIQITGDNSPSDLCDKHYSL